MPIDLFAAEMPRIYDEPGSSSDRHAKRRLNGRIVKQVAETAGPGGRESMDLQIDCQHQGVDAENPW